MWYEMQNVQAADGALGAEIRVPADSAWFNGHFPGNPVLPGIAQLGMVIDLIRRTAPGPVKVAEVSRVRFKQMILPEDRLRVTVESRPAKAGTYGFRITRQDEVVCSGMLRAEGINDLQAE